MSEYYYRDQRIRIPRTASVEQIISSREGSHYQDEIQAAIDQIAPWELGDQPHRTLELPLLIGSRVVRLAANEKPHWAINIHDRARTSGVSPYIVLEKNDPRYMTSLATIQLAGTPSDPLLVRGYPGEYYPPLPWMSSAKNEPGGIESCEAYWRNHAYVLRPEKNPRQFAQPLLTAPSWYTDIEPRQSS